MPAQLLGTLALAIAALLTLMLGLATQMFTARAPQGADAMGLAAVFLGMALRWGLIVLAALICVGRGSFDWISPRSGVPCIAVLGVCVGLAVVFAASWIQWTTPRQWWTTSVGNVGAILLPLAAQAYLMTALWSPGETFGLGWGWARGVGAGFATVSAPGLVAGLIMLGIWQKGRIERADAQIAQAMAESRELERRDALSNTDRLKEDLAAMPDTSVFWQVAGFFDSCKTQEERVLVAQRLDKVPNLAEEIVGNLSCPYASYRNRAAIFVGMIKPPGEAWFKTIAKPIELLSEDIGKARSLKGPDGEDYAEYCTNLLAAARHFRPTLLAGPLAALRSAVDSTPDSPGRSQSLDEIDRYLAAEGAPVSVDATDGEGDGAAGEVR